MRGQEMWGGGHVRCIAIEEAGESTCLHEGGERDGVGRRQEEQWLLYHSFTGGSITPLSQLII